MTLEQLLGQQPAPANPLLEKIKGLGDMAKKVYGTLGKVRLTDNRRSKSKKA